MIKFTTNDERRITVCSFPPYPYPRVIYSHRSRNISMLLCLAVEESEEREIKQPWSTLQVHDLGDKEEDEDSYGEQDRDVIERKWPKNMFETDGLNAASILTSRSRWTSMSSKASRREPVIQPTDDLQEEVKMIVHSLWWTSPGVGKVTPEMFKQGVGNSQCQYLKGWEHEEWLKKWSS